MADFIHPPSRAMIRYAIKDRLAGSPRPGYSLDRDRRVPKPVVDAWIADAMAHGIRSIICLLHDEHLELYDDLGSDLVAYYRQHGFDVTHISVRDHQPPSLDADALERIARAYVTLPQPVLVHCIAGVDRTGRALEYLKQRFDDAAPSSMMGTTGRRAP
jgi:protein tyrosine phosphatase (PTP) superfamily phosphohydrolase (DUF442 family)